METASGGKDDQGSGIDEQESDWRRMDERLEMLEATVERLK